MIRFPFSTLTRTFPPGAANGDNARLPTRARMAIKLDIVFITFASFTNFGTLGFPRAGWLYGRLLYNHLYIHYRFGDHASQQNSTSGLSRRLSAKRAERDLTLKAYLFHRHAETYLVRPGGTLAGQTHWRMDFSGSA